MHCFSVSVSISVTAYGNGILIDIQNVARQIVYLLCWKCIITDREVLSVSIVIVVVAVGFFSAATVDTPYSKI